VMRAEDLAPTFAESIYLATTGRPGPVHIDIPKDVFLEEAEFRWPERVHVRGYHIPGAAAEDEVRRAAELIDAAERPIIFAGHGIILGDAAEELRAFAEHAGIPIITTLLGLGSIDQRHPLSYGMMGMHGSYHANMAASSADLILGLGMRMDDRALFRYPPGYAPQPLDEALDWGAWGGFLGAVEMCNNNGACRKSGALVSSINRPSEPR